MKSDSLYNCGMLPCVFDPSVKDAKRDEEDDDSGDYGDRHEASDADDDACHVDSRDSARHSERSNDEAAERRGGGGTGGNGSDPEAAAADRPTAASATVSDDERGAGDARNDDDDDDGDGGGGAPRGGAARRGGGGAASFSSRDARPPRSSPVAWRHAGVDVCYYRNQRTYARAGPPPKDGKVGSRDDASHTRIGSLLWRLHGGYMTATRIGSLHNDSDLLVRHMCVNEPPKLRSHYTLTFTLALRPSAEFVYVAHCIPYTYSDLQRELRLLEVSVLVGSVTRFSPRRARERASRWFRLVAF